MRVGCDLVHIPRIARLAENAQFLNRIFHPDELKSSQERGSLDASLAARFGAKEAFTKALGTGIFAEGIAPTDVWVLNDDRGRPELQFAPHVKERLKTLGYNAADISLSHQGEYAMAVVILFNNNSL